MCSEVALSLINSRDCLVVVKRAEDTSEHVLARASLHLASPRHHQYAPTYYFTNIICPHVVTLSSCEHLL